MRNLYPSAPQTVGTRTMARSCRSLNHGASAWRAKSRLIRANSKEGGYTTGALSGRFADRHPCGAFLVVAPPKARKPVDDDHLERCLTSLSESSLLQYRLWRADAGALGGRLLAILDHRASLLRSVSHHEASISRACRPRFKITVARVALIIAVR